MNHEHRFQQGKRIHELENRILLYEQHKADLVIFAYNLKKQYQNREISFEEYLAIFDSSFKGRTLEGLLNSFDVIICKSYEEISKIKREIDKVNHKKQKTPKIPYVILLLLVVLFSGALYKYGPNITGYTVFTTEMSNKDILNLEFNQSQYYIWNISHPQQINSLMISGSITGVGTAGVYLMHDTKKYLLYEAQNEDSGMSFSDVCLETCILPRLNETSYQLYIEVHNARLVLSSLSYYLLETYDLDVYPKRNVIRFTPDYQQKYELTILNTEKRNFDATAYVEGNLSPYVSLSDSLIHFAGEPSKIITYELSLPENYSSGNYEGNIVIRYLPLGTFKGETPKTVHTIELMVPYPEVTASADLEITNINSKEIMIVVPVTNLGTQDFMTNALFDIYNDTTKMKSIETESIPVLAGTKKELSVPFESSFGNYHIAAKIYYGNKTMKLEKDFALDQESVSISDVKTGQSSSATRGVSFDIWVKNQLQKNLKNAYFELYVYDTYDNFITKVVSDLVTIAQGEELKITSTVNPQEFIPGSYRFKIVMHYDNDSVEKIITAQITKDSIEIIPEKENTKPSYEQYLVILAIILVIMNLSWFAYYLKHKL